jgi:hypothetical protein
MALSSVVDFQPQTVGIAIVTVLYLLIRYLNQTDVPRIQNLPEIPGIPIFGNLIQLGDEHARKAAEWAKKYGAVFQVRMGNRVRLFFFFLPLSRRSSRSAIENHFRQHLRLGQIPLDHAPIQPDLAAHVAHLPQGRVQLTGVHHWHVSVGRLVQAPTQSRGDGAESTGGAVVHAHHRSGIDEQHQRNLAGQ